MIYDLLERLTPRPPVGWTRRIWSNGTHWHVEYERAIPTRKAWRRATTFTMRLAISMPLDATARTAQKHCRRIGDMFTQAGCQDAKYREARK